MFRHRKAILPFIARETRALLLYLGWSRHITRTSRRSGRTASRRPTDGGEASPTPRWLVTSTAPRRSVASLDFVVTPVIPIGCSCSLVVKGASVPHVTPNEPRHSPPSSTTMCSKTCLTRCGCDHEDRPQRGPQGPAFRTRAGIPRAGSVGAVRRMRSRGLC